MSLEPKIPFSAYASALLLWILTAMLSVLVMLAGRELVIRNYLRFLPTRGSKADLFHV